MEIKKIRAEKGVSQIEVCKAAGISQSFYSSIESGVRRPSVEVAKKIGEFLGFDWTLFFEERSGNEAECVR